MQCLEVSCTVRRIYIYVVRRQRVKHSDTILISFLYTCERLRYLLAAEVRDFFSSPKRLDRLWSLPILLFDGYRGYFLEVKRPERETDHCPAFCAEVNNENCTCMPSCRGEGQLYFRQGKAIPVQAWTGTDGSRRLRLTDFKTIGTRRW